jgi:hypothetical protein
MSPSAIADTAAGERIFRTRPQQLAPCHFAAMPILEMKEHGWAVIRERVGEQVRLSDESGIMQSLACPRCYYCRALRKLKQLARWFAISGAVGILVAIVLYVSTFLCPEMSLGLAEPFSPAAVALLLGWVFGTNFVLYGTVGAVLRGAWSWLSLPGLSSVV